MNAAGSDPFGLSGKTILVTGGTRGIGEAISLRFARAGARVIANYVRNEQAAQLLKSTAEAEGHDVKLCRADLATDRGFELLTQCLDDGVGELSGLIHCAATGTHRRIDELTERHFDFTFNLNVRAFFKLTKLLLPRFSKEASIVAISSLGATRSLPYYTLVGSSKGALESLSRHLAVELAPRGIRVNILTAGTVFTDAWKSMPDSEARMAEAARRNPSGRLTTPEEVAFAAQFLCSRASVGIIGQTLFVDGGATTTA